MASLQQAFLAVSTGRTRAGDSKDSSQAQAEGIRLDVLDAHCHTRRTLRYVLSRSGATPHSVQWEGPYKKKLDEEVVVRCVR